MREGGGGGEEGVGEGGREGERAEREDGREREDKRLGGGGGGELFPTAHTHHQNDSCIKKGGSESQFTVSFTAEEQRHN